MTVTSTTSTPSPQSSTQADLSAGQANLSTSYNTFLQLLTTQLQHQDPTSPLDANQFTAQLVEMTGVQQQLLTNQLLQQLVSGSQSGGISQAVGLMGKTVTAQSDTATLSNGQAGWTYTLPSTAKAATASISDSTGRMVWSGDVSDLTAGSHAFTWNGKNSSGTQLPDGGSYTLKIAAQDAAGVSVTPALSITGVAGSVQQANGQTLVSIGATQVPLTSITKVSAS